MTPPNFVDLWNPTQDEIRRWASTPDADIPEQDWEYAVIDEPNYGLIFSLAGTADCPGKQFFVQCLYMIVGHAMHPNCGYDDWDVIKAMISDGSGNADYQVRRWAQEAQALLASPDTFRCDEWCGGKKAWDSWRLSKIPD